MKRFVAVLIGAALLTSCSPSKKEKRAVEVYNVTHHQLPVESVYGRTAWVQPPHPIPQVAEGRAWETEGGAPLLKPDSNPAVKLNLPKLPSAMSDRKY